MNVRGLFVAESGLRPANFARRRRALWATVVALAVTLVLVVIDVLTPNWLVVVAAVVAALEVVLAWLARIAYGWSGVTPARMVAVKLVRWAPVGVFAVGGIVMAVLAGLGWTGSSGMVMFSILAMMVAGAAAGVAGASN